MSNHVSQTAAAPLDLETVPLRTTQSVEEPCVAAHPTTRNNPSKAARFYQPELDALRFFAFACVFIRHSRSSYGAGGEGLIRASTKHPSLLAALWKTFHGSLASGVSLFFFLSAYLITTLLMMELEATGAIHIPSFYVRRALRIWPLYFTYVLLLVALGAAVPGVRMHLSEILAIGGFYENWYRIEQPQETAALAGALWSISIEEQFYLLWPLCARLLKGRGLAVLSVTGLAISCLLLLWFGRSLPASSLRLNTFVQLLFLVGGTLMALVLKGRQPRVPLLLRPLLVCAGLGLWLAGDLAYERGSLSSTFWPLLDYLLVLLGVTLIFFAFLGLGARWIPRWLAYLGKISYGLYIWHILAFWAVSQLVHTRANSKAVPAISLLLTMLVAWASYRWLEKPFLSLKERFTFVRSRGA